MQTKKKIFLASYALTQRGKKWRVRLSYAATVGMLVAFVYWGWQHRLTLQRVFVDFGPVKLMAICLLLTLGIVLSAWSFTILVRSMGYQFAYQDGYHSLNLSQIAAMLPGKIWGLTGLVGLLWSRGVSKPDSALVIFLHTLLMLSAAVCVGILGLLPTIGWGYTLLCLLPLLLLLTGHSWCETLRARFLGNSSALPSARNLCLVLLVGLGSWIVVSACFALLVYGLEAPGLVSPFLVTSAFAAGYVGGVVNPVMPAGLGVREGIITLILGANLGNEQALAVALVFRMLHTAVLWLHIAITLSILSLDARVVQKDPC